MKHFLGNSINAIKSKNKRKDNRKSRLRIDEQSVQDIISLAFEWKYNLFDTENQNLQILQTGTYASKEAVNNFE